MPRWLHAWCDQRGVGYQLPANFLAVINGILSVFTKYKITGSGHLFEVPDYLLHETGRGVPNRLRFRGESRVRPPSNLSVGTHVRCFCAAHAAPPRCQEMADKATKKIEAEKKMSGAGTVQRDPAFKHF